MSPMNLYFIRRFMYSHKELIFLFALLCGLTGGSILTPVDKGIDLIEKAYPASSDAMEVVRSGSHGINSAAQLVVNLKSQYDAVKK